MLLSSLLLNAEAWVNLSDKDIRALERTDEILLSKILGSDSNTSNTFKYLELGIYPIRFKIMKGKVIFLQYILKQEKENTMYKLFKATSENPANLTQLFFLLHLFLYQIFKSSLFCPLFHYLLELVVCQFLQKSS